MSQGINKSILLGNVGNDPEIRLMPGGDKVANFSLATSESWKDKQSGQRQERTEWHKIVCYNGLAQIIEDYVKKGSKLFIEGSSRTRSWQQDGVTRYITEIVAKELQLLDAKQDAQPTPPVDTYADYGQPQSETAPQQQQPEPPPGYNANGTLKSPYATNLQR